METRSRSTSPAKKTVASSSRTQTEPPPEGNNGDNGKGKMPGSFQQSFTSDNAYSDRELAVDLSLYMPKKGATTRAYPMEQVQAASAMDLQSKVKAYPQDWLDAIASALQHNADLLYRLGEAKNENITVRTELDDALRQIQTKDCDYQLLDDEIQVCVTQRDDAIQESNRLRDQVRDLQKSVKDEQDRVIRRNGDIKTLDDTLTSLRTKYKTFKAQIKDLNHTVLQRDNEITQRDNEITRLREQIEQQTSKPPRSERRNISVSPPAPPPSPRRRFNPGDDDPSSYSSSDSEGGRGRRRPDPLPRTDRARDRGERANTAAASTASTGIPHKMKIPDPPIYNGDREKFDSWINALQNKLTWDKPAFDEMGTDATVGYISSRTESIAFDVLWPHMPNNPDAVEVFQSKEDALRVLHSAFQNHDRKAKARLEFSQLKQSEKETFDEFYVKFQKAVTPLQKTEADRMEDLVEKLNKSLYFHVTRWGPQENMETLVNRIRTLDYANQKIQVQRPREKDSKDADKGRTLNNNSRRPSRPALSSSSTTSTSSTSSKPFPEKYRGLPKLTDELRKELAEKNACYACREVTDPPHRSNDPVCPLYGAGRYRNLNVSSINESPVELPTPSGNA
jgi:hypothetical protein